MRVCVCVASSSRHLQFFILIFIGGVYVWQQKQYKQQQRQTIATTKIYNENEYRKHKKIIVKYVLAHSNVCCMPRLPAFPFPSNNSTLTKIKKTQESKAERIRMEGVCSIVLLQDVKSFSLLLFILFIYFIISFFLFSKIPCMLFEIM